MLKTIVLFFALKFSKIKNMLLPDASGFVFINKHLIVLM